MHNFLFRNKLSTSSTFSPFGSSKNSKPGIITKIKNKIQDLFQPTINPSSTIQRIQCYNEQDLEQELSHQFQNNLVIVDHILPNKEEISTSKPKSFIPFDFYFEELVHKQNEISREAKINQAFKQKDSKHQLTKTKRQLKFKKNHAKIKKSRKMEENSQQRDFDLNQKSQKLNVEFRQENSSGFLSNHSNKKIKSQDNYIQTASPLQQQEGQTSNQMSQINQFEIQSFANIKQNQQFGCQLLSDQKNRFSETQNGHSCNIVNFKQIIQENQYFSSSTGTNTKGEAQEPLIIMEHISFSQETDSSQSEENYSISSSFEIQNKLFSVFHPNLEEKKQIDMKQELISNNILNELNNDQDMEQNKISIIEKSESQDQIKKLRNLAIDSEIISIQMKFNRQTQNTIINQQQKQNTIIQLQQQEKNTQEKQAFISNNHSQIEELIVENTQQDSQLDKNCHMQGNKDEKQISQQLLSEQRIPNEQLQKLQPDEKLDSPMSQNSLLSVNYESATKNLNMIQESDQQKDLINKSDQMIKEKNPFLDTSSHIGSDQVSQYFLSGLLTGNSSIPQQQYQVTKNPNFIDLFKMPTNNSLFKFNVLSENQVYQTQTQNLFNQQNIPQKNNQCLIYKQMEIIDQIPQQDQFSFNYHNNYVQQMSNYYLPNIEQKYQCQPDSYQQSQPSTPWISYQSPIQQSNLFPQMQQSSYQISSINLFQSNQSMANPNPNCFQEESRINHIYTKQDVLSLFQDTNKKQDQNLFVIDSVQSSNSQSQNLNSSFTRGYRKKQRINNN